MLYILVFVKEECCFLALLVGDLEQKPITYLTEHYFKKVFEHLE
ncbi:hypothetical protein SAMD00020551_1148 [Mesobacillus selenatarsenatis SF-1]|uniref:Uncharacterized protein n=1 Tax=Mesobacillus selenatarsenatis (strain DSM 18680 / JCM 14380 / FERM P-15431 / SF-1) TaxID=1321606 RepID=A0A0A8WZD3_MESS1|nr:hypothetical protein SAMD00020551_1148 [Mesobacillus selenatarsenatis SF-1]